VKKIFIILLSVIVFAVVVKSQCNETLVTVCCSGLAKNATYLKELKVKLKAKEAGKKEPIAKYSLMLNKGTHYRFSVCNAKEFTGKAILQLYDKDRLLGSSYMSNKHFPAFDFVCNKTAVYQVLMSFEDGQEGCAVGVLSMIE
jgi:hypothetical protein